ncbi:uncharacterized protein LOC126739919 [Anthonomus grandis grandis]|uniref:uncharacterized protein LOC126739919 n=1 Tax=Anthonomus grandis grandis TaxID=2921223 RepID=UPI0021666936|nr:uncharacterized protein LOC126739919 [Anthonomus grandis grandis]
MFQTKIIIFILTLLWLIIFPVAHLASVRLYFSKCGTNGFTCITNAVTKKWDITYQCPNGVNDITLYINQFTAPQTLQDFKIQNCQSVTILTRCSNENKPIKTLQIANVAHLSIQRAPYEPWLPPTVIFENISYIDEIPAKTFGQIDKSIYTTGCFVHPIEFQNVLFKNVTIGAIKSEAFVAHHNFHNFTFLNVTVGTIQTSAINIRHDLSGQFEIMHSNIKEIEPLGIRIYGKKAVFAMNDLKEVASSGINATTEHFYFTGNTVGTLQAQAFAVLSTNIYILDNNFQSVKCGAFEKLSPGLLQDSGRNFGKLNFIYDFSKNTLHDLEIGSLHPDYASYENVRTEMMFGKNKIMCSCENLGWLFLPAVMDQLIGGPFYEMVMDDSYGNMCANMHNSSCKFHISVVNKLIQCGKCLSNITLKEECEKVPTIHYTTEGANLNVLSNSSVAPSNYITSFSFSHNKSSILIRLLFLNIVLLLDY